jgi:hypothetical protein
VNTPASTAVIAVLLSLSVFIVWIATSLRSSQRQFI